MKERNERIERLLERYFDAQATDAEERELRDYFGRTEDIPTSLRYAQAMFGGLDSLAGETLSGEREMSWQAGEIPRRDDAIPVAGRRASLERRLRPLWGVAAAAILALGFFFYTEYVRKPYCYIDGVAIYDKDVAMQTTIYLEGLSDFGEQVRMVNELMMND